LRFLRPFALFAFPFLALAEAARGRTNRYNEAGHDGAAEAAG